MRTTAPVQKVKDLARRIEQSRDLDRADRYTGTYGGKQKRMKLKRKKNKTKKSKRKNKNKKSKRKSRKHKK
jgi:hypothetical protein